MPRSLIRGTHFPNVHETLDFQLTRISLDTFRQCISLRDMIDPSSLLHDDVLCFDHRASRQKIIFVSHFYIAQVHGLF